MKKRILALACAMIMVFAMGINVCAASPTASATAGAVASKPAVSDDALTIGTQKLTADTVASMATTTTVTSDVAATVSAVSTETAAYAVHAAKVVVSNNAYIATVVDLKVPAGTGAASFTLNVPNVLKGQKVTILHLKADGNWEAIAPSNVANGAVTFTLTSYSPVAVVVDTTAPKTADPVTGVAALALVSLAGTAVFGKKKDN